MKQVKKKSVIPPYAVAALWIVRAFSGKLSSFGDIIGCAALSIVLMIVLKMIFPDKMVEVEENAAEPDKAAKKPEAKAAEPVNTEEHTAEKAEKPVRKILFHKTAFYYLHNCFLKKLFNQSIPSPVICTCFSKAGAVNLR